MNTTEERSPEIWTKTHLGKYLWSTALDSLIIYSVCMAFLLPIILLHAGILGIKIMLICLAVVIPLGELISFCRERKRHKNPCVLVENKRLVADIHDGKAECYNYGVGDTTNYNINSFAKKYSIIMLCVAVAVFCALMFALILPLLNQFENYSTGVFWGLALSIFFDYLLLKICIGQITAVWFFEDEIKKFACPRCGWVNTWIISKDFYNESTYKSTLVVGHNGNKNIESGHIYSEGKKVATIFTKNPNWEIHQDYEYHSYTTEFTCSHCGIKTEVSGRHSKGGPVGKQY